MKLPLLLFGLIAAIQASPAPAPVPALAPISAVEVRSPTDLSAREKVVSRTINLTSKLVIRDDEPWPVNHRTYTRSHTLPPVIIGTKTGYTQKVSYEAKVGGEIRVEVHVTLTLRPSDLSVLVNYQMLLFEGTSENTKDLDGKIEGSRRIFKNTDGLIKNTVHNTDEGGDRASLDLTVVNAP
ncbi:hypothetical protein QBC40DRAFT_324910 [Triangularia verruculosa]|uniref:Uncharacterized protein n=1 Tax=Triangularia verruculosa TaxID=2587418 RepID=A0AAN6XNT1_9PEZI|nr:hypothetical protein QBC40DRAFT_324910 [Triangularia verruculosa]